MLFCRNYWKFPWKIYLILRQIVRAFSTEMPWANHWEILKKNYDNSNIFSKYYGSLFVWKEAVFSLLNCFHWVLGRGCETVSGFWAWLYVIVEELMKLQNSNPRFTFPLWLYILFLNLSYLWWITKKNGVSPAADCCQVSSPQPQAG